jgi:hypothetical protein
VLDSATGEVIEVELLVAVGGIPKITVPINFGARCELRVATSQRSRARVGAWSARRHGDRSRPPGKTSRQSEGRSPACNSLRRGAHRGKRMASRPVAPAQGESTDVPLADSPPSSRVTTSLSRAATASACGVG